MAADPARMTATGLSASPRVTVSISPSSIARADHWNGQGGAQFGNAVIAEGVEEKRVIAGPFGLNASVDIAETR
jgi:hypothetical protein